MRRWRHRVMGFAHIALLSMLLGGSATSAQDVTGSLEGLVLGAGDSPIADAVVIASSASLQGTRTATTSRRGFFRLPSLPPGNYTVQVQHPGYQELALEAVQITLGQTTGLRDVRLQKRAMLEEKVVVIAPRPEIDPWSAAAGDSISAEYFEGIPTARNYRSIAELLPHVNVSYLGDETNYAGGTGLDNRYFIDGIDVTDPWRGTTGTNLLYNFIKEVDVKLGGYEAEYRSALGGIVNVITHSGSNELKFDVWGYFTDNALAGEVQQSVVELQTEDFSKYDVGASISGPVIQDRLWYHAAYNPAVIKADVEIPGTGFYPDETTLHSFAGKLTWQIDRRNNLVFTAIGDPTTRDGVGDTMFFIGTPAEFENPDPYLRDIETGGYNLALRGSHILGRGLLLESYLSGVSRRDKNQPATQRGRDEPLFLDAETGIWSGGGGPSVDNQSTQFTLGLKVIRPLGDHEIRAGVEYRHNSVDVDQTWDEVDRFDDVTWVTFVMDQQGTVGNRVTSLFIQDSWRVASRWRLNFGLRWDGQNLIGSDGETAQRINDQYQPRLGFIYLPGRPGSQRIYGSAGRFYHDLATYLPTVAFMVGGGFGITLYGQDPRIDPSGGIPLAEPRSEISPPIDGLRGQYHDEFSLGYERAIGSRYKLGARVVYRTLGEAIEDAFVAETGEFAFGNPGRGELADYPSAERDYTALELSLASQPGRRFSFLTSYVLSRNEGNYPGLFNSDYEIAFPNANASFDFPDQVSSGDLPNDRTHVFRFSGFYRFDFGLTAGTFLVWQSGTPLNEFGGSVVGPPYVAFIRPRGTAGRTPSIFDFNLRLTYDVKLGSATKWNARFILDGLHLFSPRDPVDFEQTSYFALDDQGNQILPNPLYGIPTRFQPPATLRLGMEFGF